MLIALNLCMRRVPDECVCICKILAQHVPLVLVCLPRLIFISTPKSARGVNIYLATIKAATPPKTNVGNVWSHPGHIPSANCHAKVYLNLGKCQAIHG